MAESIRITKPGKEPEQQAGWERAVLEKLAMAAVQEQRRARRWGIFFKLLLVLYLLALLVLSLPYDWEQVISGKFDHTAVIDIEGLIAANAEASADNVATALRDAYEDRHTKGIVLRINSPGGTPVQAGYIYDEIRRLKQENPDIPVYAVIVDICASGGYYVASAADAIYASRSSVVGSIGVRMDGFGFVGTMEKLGVERRLLTAGEHKAFLDPFSPVRDDEVQHVETLLDDIHQQFINQVKQGRGERLKDDPRLYSGLIWTGEQGRELGLVDDFGSTGYVAREVIGAEETVNYTVQERLYERLARRIGTSISDGFMRFVSGYSDATPIR